MQHAMLHILNPLVHAIKLNLQLQNGYDLVDQLALSWLPRCQQQTVVARVIQAISMTHFQPEWVKQRAAQYVITTRAVVIGKIPSL